jgi:hypothetical protein
MSLLDLYQHPQRKALVNYAASLAYCPAHYYPWTSTPSRFDVDINKLFVSADNKAYAIVRLFDYLSYHCADNLYAQMDLFEEDEVYEKCEKFVNKVVVSEYWVLV